MSSNDSPRAVDVYGASQRTGLSVRTLRWRREADQGPPSYRLGKRVMYDVAALDAWVESEKADSLRGSQ
jgi:predicted DNA-binding transcriptional regulator AlpA